MTKPKPAPWQRDPVTKPLTDLAAARPSDLAAARPSDQEADRLAADLIIEHAWLKGEVRRLRAALEELSEYSHDCDHDVIARRALAEQK